MDFQEWNSKLMEAFEYDTEKGMVKLFRKRNSPFSFPMSLLNLFNSKEALTLMQLMSQDVTEKSQSARF